MSPLLGALILMLLGLLGARISYSGFRPLFASRMVYAAGIHFLILGFLLGRNALNLLTPEVIRQLYPFLALGLGWIGLLFGLQLDRHQLSKFPRRFLAIAMAQAVITLLVFLGVGLLALQLAGASGAASTLGLLVAAATASVSTPAAIAGLGARFLVRGQVSQLLMFIASLDAVIGITALQIIYAYYPPLAFGAIGAPAMTGSTWLAIAVGLGVLFSVLFLWLTRPRPEREELMMFMLGLVLFAAAAALYLGLSPLFLCGLIGAVIANFSPMRRRVYTLLKAWEKPVYVILLILAGALLHFPGLIVVGLAAGYTLLRTAGKLLGSFLAVRTVGADLEAPTALGVGLLPQGGISLAMVVSVTLTYPALQWRGVPLVEVLFSTILIGIVTSELAGPPLTRWLLDGLGELAPRPEEREPQVAGAGS